MYNCYRMVLKVRSDPPRLNGALYYIKKHEMSIVSQMFVDFASQHVPRSIFLYEFLLLHLHLVFSGTKGFLQSMVHVIFHTPTYIVYASRYLSRFYKKNVAEIGFDGIQTPNNKCCSPPIRSQIMLVPTSVASNNLWFFCLQVAQITGPVVDHGWSCTLVLHMWTHMGWFCMYTLIFPGRLISCCPSGCVHRPLLRIVSATRVRWWHGLNRRSTAWEAVRPLGHNPSKIYDLALIYVINIPWVLAQAKVSKAWA